MRNERVAQTSQPRGDNIHRGIPLHDFTPYRSHQSHHTCLRRTVHVNRRRWKEGTRGGSQDDLRSHFRPLGKEICRAMDKVDVAGQIDLDRPEIRWQQSAIGLVIMAMVKKALVNIDPGITDGGMDDTPVSMCCFEELEDLGPVGDIARSKERTLSYGLCQCLSTSYIDVADDHIGAIC